MVGLRTLSTVDADGEFVVGFVRHGLLGGTDVLAAATLTDDDLRKLTDMFLDARVKMLALAGGRMIVVWNDDERRLTLSVESERDRLRGRSLDKFRQAVIEARDKRFAKQVRERAEAEVTHFTTPEVQDLSEASEPDPREQDEVEVGRELSERVEVDLDAQVDANAADTEEELARTRQHLDHEVGQEGGEEDMATKMKPAPKKAPAKRKGPGQAPPKIGPGKKKKSAHARQGGTMLEGRAIKTGDVLVNRKSGLQHKVVGFAEARTKVRLQALESWSNQPEPRAVSLRSIAAHYVRA